VVGVDESAAAREAIRWGVAQARVSGAAVHLVHAWEEPLSWADQPYLEYPAMGPLLREPFDPEQEEPGRAAMVHQKLAGLRAAAQQEAEQALREAIGALPTDPAVQVEAVQGDARHVLVDATATAELLVVGSHRSSGVAAAVLGSISHHCALHAHCPVVIVPAGVQISAEGRPTPAGSRHPPASSAGSPSTNL
jgi:nucleotide-binding universal stress UspA family protein